MVCPSLTKVLSLFLQLSYFQKLTSGYSRLQEKSYIGSTVGMVPNVTNNGTTGGSKTAAAFIQPCNQKQSSSGLYWRYTSKFSNLRDADISSQHSDPCPAQINKPSESTRKFGVTQFNNNYRLCAYGSFPNTSLLGNLDSGELDCYMKKTSREQTI